MIIIILMTLLLLLLMCRSLHRVITISHLFVRQNRVDCTVGRRGVGMARDGRRRVGILIIIVVLM